MRCVLCKYGETAAGVATVTLERDGATVVIKGVPAQVCQECGEEYVDEGVGSDLLALAEAAAAGGVQVEVREYRAA
jgi:YgiT-type zinc finger domain-containing protein